MFLPNFLPLVRRTGLFSAFLIGVVCFGGLAVAGDVAGDDVKGGLKEGLVCHLTFDDEVGDHSGSEHANDGRAVGEPAFHQGRIGKAMAILGSKGQYVDLGSPADLQFGDAKTGTDFSVSFWVRVDSAKDWPVFITNKDYSSRPAGNSSSHTGWGVFLHKDKRLRWNGKDEKNDALYIEHAGPKLDDGRWHHVAATHDRDGRAVVYVDGRAVGSALMLMLDATLDAGLPTVIGNDAVYGKGDWDGAIDDLGIWRRALEPGEVWAIYQSGQKGADLQNVAPCPALFGSDIECHWKPDMPTPVLAVTVTNHSSAPLRVSNWRLDSPKQEGLAVTVVVPLTVPLTVPETATVKKLPPGGSVEVSLAWDAVPSAKAMEGVKLVFDHNATNRKSSFSIKLARHIHRLPYKYRDKSFLARMKQSVPRDEKGQIVVNDGYHDEAMVGSLLKAFSEDYPEITTLHEIGKTHQGRSIWAIKISAKISSKKEEKKDKPACLLVAAHHANELLSTEFVLDAVHYLTTRYGTDSQVRDWVDRCEIWCIPIANPDGSYCFFHVTTSGRKNGRDNNGNGKIDFYDGVDLNRNYPFRWHSLGETGSSSNPDGGRYRGPSSGSEPETQAIMRLADRERFVSLISYHTSGTKILVPYTIDNVRNPQPSAAWTIGGHLAGLSDSGLGKRHYLPVKNLYSVDGTDQDWHYWRHGTLAYIWEGPRTNPPYPDCDRYVIGVRPGWQYLLDRIGSGPTLSGYVTDAVTGEPLEAVITLDEIKTFEDEIHTSNPTSGRYDRILPKQGTYHVHFRKAGYAPKSATVELGHEWKTLDVALTPAE